MAQLADGPVLPVGEPAFVGKIGDACADHGIEVARDPWPQPITSRNLDGDAQIFPHCQLGKDLGDLKGTRNPTPDAPRRQQIRDVLFVEQDTAGGRGQESADQIEEGRLPRAIGPDDRPQLAVLHGHRHAAHGDQTAEVTRDVIDLEQAHGAALR